MKLNFKKIASVLTSTVMLSSTIGLAAAANYPAPFVKGGNADVAIVYGTTAANSDLVAVMDITSDLQAELAAQTASSSGGSSGSSSVSGGDYVKLAKASNNINLGDTMSGVFGSRVDDDELPELLAKGTYTNDDNTEYKYEQSVTLKALQLVHFADSDYKDKEPTVGFPIPAGTNVLDYTLDFTTDAESSISSGSYSDFVTTDLTMMGRTYYVLTATNTSANTTALGTFTLLDSANTAVVAEGESQKLTVGDKEYEVSISFVGSDSAKLEINGELTKSLAEGATYKLTDGTYVGIKDILYSSKDAGVSKVEFSIGTGKLELTNGEEVELNDDTVDGMTAYIYGTHTAGTGVSLDKIVLSWTDEDGNFVTSENSMTMPGFGALKLSSGQFSMPTKEMVSIENDGDDSIELTVPIKDGDATFNILFANASGQWEGIGADNDERLATSNSSSLFFNASSGGDAWFVASYATTSEAESYLLSASVTEVDNVNKVTIKNEVTGDEVCEDKAANDDCNIGSVSLTIASVNKAGSLKNVTFTAGSGVAFHTIYTKGGLKILLPYTVTTTSMGTMADGSVNFVNSSAAAGNNYDGYRLYMIEENKDDDIAQGGKFSFLLNDGDSSATVAAVQVASTNVTTRELADTDKFEGYVYSDLATKVMTDTNPDQDTAEVEYHGSESFADVYLTAPEAAVSNEEGVVASGGTVKKLGSVSVKDSEVSSVSTKNLIVVGGSCVNSVAATLLGGALCGADFEAKAGAGAGSFVIETFSRSDGKVATLVAGYNAGDTTNAAKYLTTSTVDTMVGKKYIGTSATTATLQTTAATTVA